jgi:chromosome partitioning protein
MTRLIAIANQKGGVGKTTTTINLAAALARGLGSRKKRRVHVVDVDPQSNTTAAFLGVQSALGPATHPCIYEALTQEIDSSNALCQVELPANDKAGYKSGVVHLLPAHIRLAKAEIELQSMLQREYRLANALRPLTDQYDYVLIDCPPSLGLLTINAFITAQELLVPIEPGYFPLIGLGLLLDTVKSINRINGLSLMGVVLTMQNRTLESRETLESLQRQFGDKVLGEIPDRIAIRNAHASQQDIFGYASNNELDVAQAYARLAQEVERRGK